MKNFTYLIAAYSAIWLLIGYYFVRLGIKTNELSKKIDALLEEKK